MTKVGFAREYEKRGREGMGGIDVLEGEAEGKGVSEVLHVADDFQFNFGQC